MSEALREAPVRVFVYFDYICPYSYLVRPLIEAIAAERPLEVVWRPLETRPEMPADGVPNVGDGPDEIAPEEWERLGEQGLAAGVPLYRPAVIPCTHLTLQASEFARDIGSEAFRRLHEALFRAYFVHNVDIGAREKILEIAATEGLAREALEAALEDGRYADELAAAEREADRYEIKQTPTVFFGRYKVIGAAPIDVLSETARRASASAL